jgi:hypothetical protein
MDNIEIYQSELIDGIKDFVLISKEDGTWQSMFKSDYDEMIAKQNEASTL